MFKKDLKVFATILFWVLFTGTNIYAQETEVVEVLSVAEFKQCIDLDGVQLIDVRTPAEFAENKIERAVNIDFLTPDFSTKLSNLRKDEAVYLYCHSGGRSDKAAKILKGLGFKKVYDLRGGIIAWMKQ
ncbi:MAG: rhodanese-like domain-containing protein [Gramella sp.]|nr:rhodanese-like domain-containing protein [Christiangramia sp.]